MTPTRSKDLELDPVAIDSRLTTQYVGRTCESYAEIDSTNRRAVELARSGAPEGTLVLADRQTAGKGRLGRRWLDHPGASLLLSIILRPELLVHQAQRATMVCSLAMVEAVREVTGLAPSLKWPNDLLLHGGKLGGILTELGLSGRAIDFVVVGIGVNVNLDVDALADEITSQDGGARPASLMQAAGERVSRLDLLIAFLTRLEALTDRLATGWSPHTLWRDHLDTLGKEVHVGTGDEVVHGVAQDVDADGELLVRLDDGMLRQIVVGDVTLRGHIVKRDD